MLRTAQPTGNKGSAESSLSTWGEGPRVRLGRGRGPRSRGDSWSGARLRGPPSAQRLQLVAPAGGHPAADAEDPLDVTDLLEHLVEVLPVAQLADDADRAAAGLAVGVGLDRGDVAAGAGDRLGEPGEHPLLVLDLDQQRHLVDLLLPLRGLPLDLDLALRVVEQVLHVRAVDAVHR